MTSIFIAISQSLIDSGFGQALVRKKDCTDTDYSTVFYYNLIASLLLYFTLFLSAGLISRLFEEPILKDIIRILSLGVVIKAFSLIHLILLIKKIDFKTQTKVTIISSTISGIIGIIMAIKGYGVWSLVVKSLSGFLLATILLWVWHSWKPKLEFSWNSFRELFSFGSKLLITGLMNKIFSNLYYFIIGKFFSAAELGFFTRADQFKNLPSQNVNSVIQRVSYPALSSIQDDHARLKSTFLKLLRSTMLIAFFLMIGLSVVSESLVLVLIGEKWLPSVEYLQLLSIAGIFLPLQAVNQNLLKVKGKSNIILTVELIKKTLIIPVLIAGVLLGIKIMLLLIVVHAVAAFILDAHFAGKTIYYGLLRQLKDVLPFLFISGGAGGLTFVLGGYLQLNPIFILFIQCTFYLGITIFLLEIFRIKEYRFIKDIIVSKYLNIN